MDNPTLLNQLLAQGEIALEPANLINQSPSPLPEDWDFERVEGMLLGLAIGDALGNTTESQLPATCRQSHGEIRDYLPIRNGALKLRFKEIAGGGGGLGFVFDNQDHGDQQHHAGNDQKPGQGGIPWPSFSRHLS